MVKSIPVRVQLYRLLIVIFLMGCSKKGGEGKPETTPVVAADNSASEQAAPASIPSASSASSEPAPQGAAQTVKPAWRLETKQPEYPCPEAPPSSGDWLQYGRALGNEQRWGDAVLALEAALAARANDPTILSELSWAAFKAGDYNKAIDAGMRSAQQSAKPEQKAASLYNIGRAAEALGHLDRARQSYQESLALRPSDAVQKRLEAMSAAPAMRVFERGAPFGKCQDLPSLDDVCTCLAKILAQPKAPVSGPLECSVTEHRTAAGHIVEVRGKAKEDDEEGESPTVAPGAYYVLAATRGKPSWSALAIVETISDTDLELMPRGGNGGSIDAMHEQPLGDARLLWVQSTDRLADSGMGEETVAERSTLTLCKIPGDVTETSYCYAPLSLSEIEYIHGASPGQEEEKERCQVLGQPSIYRAILDSTGVLQLVLVQGKDAKGLAGSWRL